MVTLKAISGWDGIGWMGWLSYRVPQKKLSLVEIGCGKYITVVTSPFTIVLALIYPRHSPGGPGHSIGEVGCAHGGRQGQQGGHKERL